MLLGYHRVSTKDQSPQLQIDALRKYGCERFYSDVVSGAKASRPGLDEMLKEARPKDVIVVWKLDRLGRLRFAQKKSVNKFQKPPYSDTKARSRLTLF